jgi:hypothetical protein
VEIKKLSTINPIRVPTYPYNNIEKSHGFKSFLGKQYPSAKSIIGSIKNVNYYSLKCQISSKVCPGANYEI